MKIAEKSGRSLSEWACKYASIGLYPVALREGGKIPISKSWQRTANIEAGLIQQAWTKHPNANIGLHCGKSGLVVVDIDPRNGGEETLRSLENGHGCLWDSKCLVQKTAGGGEHYVFRAPEALNISSKLGLGIDLLHGNRQFVVSPSFRDDVGRRYEWSKGCGPFDRDLASLDPLPDWIIKLAKVGDSFTAESIADPLAMLSELDPRIDDSPAERQRIREALSCIDADCDRSTYIQILMAVNSTGWFDWINVAREWACGDLAKRPSVKFDARQFSSDVKGLSFNGGITVGTLFHIARSHGFEASHSPSAKTPDTFGDISNGQRFAAAYRGQFLYIHAVKKWLRFDGFRWVWCERGEATVAARLIATNALDEAFFTLRNAHTEVAKSNYAQALSVHRNSHRLDGLLKIAASEDGMSLSSPAMLDTDPMLLGVRNGVVSLKSGTLLDSDPAMYISRQVGASFKRGAACPKWLNFLSDIFNGNQEVIDFIQRSIGYALTGLMDEEILFFLLGVGANGKSVFANILQAIFGEYAVTVRATMLARDSKGNNNEAEREKGRLPGARLVLINEVGHHDVFDDQRVKELVSRERIGARALYGESFDFMPSHTIFIRGNHQPVAMDVSDGFWRRIALVNFEKSFPESARITDLDRKILDSERDGILWWAILGCLEWQRNGLKIPSKIRIDSDQYRRDSDQLGEWLDAHCKRDSSFETPVGVLYISYCEFLSSGGMKNPSKPSFSRQLTQRGFRLTRTNSARLISGLRIVDDEWSAQARD